MAFTLVLVHLVVLATATAVVNVKDSYSYMYSVNSEATGDFKSHQESRSGGLVRGSYSVLEPGGILRIVEYTADPIRGFRAVVHRRALSAGNTTSTSTTSQRSPSTAQRSPSTAHRPPSTTQTSPSTAQTSPSTTQTSTSNTGSLTTSTHTPDNLGHFAAAMFSTRRKIFYKRRQQ